HGLSLPFFIKLDDAEFGLRVADSTRVITMNGAAVFHESFQKKFSFPLEYNIIRNELVTAAIHGSSAADAVKLFVRCVGKHILLYRYDNIPLVLRAVRDFFGGVDFFLACDEEKLNDEIRGLAPKLCPLSDIPEWREDMRRRAEYRDGYEVSAGAVLAQLVPACFLDKEITAQALDSVQPADCAMRRCVIQYQADGSMGIVTRHNAWKFVKYGFLAAVYAARLAFGFGRMRRQYSERCGEITSMDFWRRHLGL
ncbi:MAG: hypothetical protein ACI4Q4_01945, partial [Oscillospiraceae bacterium]